MKIYENGIIRDMTAAEIAAMQEVAAKAEAEEKRRPLNAEEVTAMLIRQQINTLEVDDNTALRMREFYPEWAVGVDYTAAYKVRYGGKLWRCVQAHTSQTGWEPSIDTASLWTEICETHDGSKYDPIPYDGNMELTAGLYYTQGSVTYLCNRGTGQPVYNTLADLVGLYVEVAE